MTKKIKNKNVQKEAIHITHILLVADIVVIIRGYKVHLVNFQTWLRIERMNNNSISKQFNELQQSAKIGSIP